MELPLANATFDTESATTTIDEKTDGQNDKQIDRQSNREVDVQTDIYIN
jgi:hypothetical protein